MRTRKIWPERKPRGPHYGLGGAEVSEKADIAQHLLFTLRESQSVTNRIDCYGRWVAEEGETQHRRSDVARAMCENQSKRERLVEKLPKKM